MTGVFVCRSLSLRGPVRMFASLVLILFAFCERTIHLFFIINIYLTGVHIVKARSIRVMDIYLCAQEKAKENVSRYLKID